MMRTVIKKRQLPKKPPDTEKINRRLPRPVMRRKVLIIRRRNSCHSPLDTCAFYCISETFFVRQSTIVEPPRIMKISPFVLSVSFRFIPFHFSSIILKERRRRKVEASRIRSAFYCSTNLSGCQQSAGANF